MSNNERRRSKNLILITKDFLKSYSSKKIASSTHSPLILILDLIWNSIVLKAKYLEILCDTTSYFPI